MIVASYVLGAIAAVIALLVCVLDEDRDTRNWLVCVGICCVVIGGFCWNQDRLWKGDAKNRPKRNPSNQSGASSAPPTDGALTPGTDTTPILPPIPIKIAERIPRTATYVFFGNSLACIDKFPFTIIRQRDEPMVTLDRSDGKLLLSAKIFDDRGKVMCEIDKNTFRINRNNVFRFENDSPHHLAVIDDELQRVLDVEYINQEAIRFSGDFHLRRGTRAIVTKSTLEFRSDERLLAIDKPLILLDNDEGFGLGIDFPDDANKPPELSLVGAVVADKSIRWVGSKSPPDDTHKKGDDTEKAATPGGATTETNPEVAGYLRPGNKPTPPIGNEMPDAVALLFGGHCVFAKDFPCILIAQENEPMISLHKTGDKLSISAKCFNADGKIVCDVIDNHFQRHPNHSHRVIHPYGDDTRIIITDDRAVEVVDIEFLNPRAIRIAGKFYLRKQVPVVITDDFIRFYNGFFFKGMRLQLVGAGAAAFWLDPPKGASFCWSLKDTPWPPKPGEQPPYPLDYIPPKPTPEPNEPPPPE